MHLNKSPFLMSMLLFTIATTQCLGQDAETSPKQTIQNWAKAIISKDSKKVLRFYAKSENLIVIGAAQQRKGFAAVKKMWDQAYKEASFSDSNVSELTTVQVKDVTWATARLRIKLRVRADNGKYQLEVRTTFVLKKNKNKWQIVMEHSSPIKGVPRLKRMQ